jgi:hypothetical protein
VNKQQKTKIMALGFSVRVYGTMAQQPPFSADVNGNLAGVQATFTGNQIQLQNFPTANVNLWAIQPGVRMDGGVYCYGVIELPAPEGLSLHSDKFIVKENVVTLATLRG